MLRVYLIKIFQKINHLAKKYKTPMKVLPLDTFYTTHFGTEKPNSYYFLNRSEPKFYFDPSEYEKYTNALQTNHPNAVKRTLSRAEDALNHQFTLLSSKETELSRKINWHQDFISGTSWNNQHHSKIKIINQDDNSDIKIPWELSRLQHFTDLGKAFWITEDEVYLREFVTIMIDWEKENQVGYGPNWTCSMEVAIRAINMIWGLYFFSSKNLLSDEFIQRSIRLLYYHGLHIEQNLETIEDGANTNHLLSNYLGLFYLGLLFPEFDKSKHWRQISCEGLEKEIIAEINNDGADYECSTSYHRLVAEIFLSAYILGKKNNFEFSNDYKNRLQKIVQFSESITTQQGSTPYVGDNDDGFIVKLSHDNPASHNHIIELGAELFNKTYPSLIQRTEESLFYFGVEQKQINKNRKLTSKLFKDSGYAVIRSEKLHLLFAATKITPKALGGHKHNDNLAFTLEYNKIPYFIDPGTFCYTSDFDMRNRNRSVSYHNTVSIDAEEQNKMFNSRLFFLHGNSKSQIDLWANLPNTTIVSGVHRGYEKNKSIQHRRTIQVNLQSSQIEITDEFTGNSTQEHLFETRFITPVENVTLQKNQQIHLKENQENVLVLSFDLEPDEKIEIAQTEYFPRYGVSNPAKIIKRKQNAKLPLINKTIIAINDTIKQDMNQLEIDTIEQTIEAVQLV